MGQRQDHWQGGRSLRALVFVLAMVGLASPSLAQSTPDHLLQGLTQYLRTSGAPNEYTDKMTVPTSVGEPFLLHIVNGQSNGQNRISSRSFFRGLR